MQEIPPAKDSDAEDVVWGLQTAASLWSRGERTDAVAWLRRAAQAASDAEDDMRAIELARIAAELADRVAAESVAIPDLSGGGQEETTALDALPNVTSEHMPSVPPAEKVHEGMLDPWSDQTKTRAPDVPDEIPVAISIPPLPEPAASEPPLPRFPDPEEIVTSVKGQTAPSAPAPPKPPPVGSRKPPPLPPRAQAKKSAPALEPAPAPAPAPEPEPPALDLEGVEAFADLPDDARAAFAAAGKVHVLAEGEEVAGFALAYVLEGAFDVAATMVDAPAVKLAEGAVLRSRGTTNEGVPMRIIAAASRGVVATWSGADVEQAFAHCPWVEEDLRAASDRVMTLVGITIGPLGERLDQSIREEIVGRLTVRPLLPGEIVVEKGAPVPGLLLVGVGDLELVDGDEVKGVVSSGDFLFATEVLGAGAAPQTARAGAGGALVMFGDRHIAQELMVTCPPLLEVFAGM